MQPKNLLIALALLLSVSGFSQSATLDINNVSALFHPRGDMGWDLIGISRYEVPKGSGRTTIFASNMWLGGLDASGQLHLAAQRYRSNGNDFFPGPVNGQGVPNSNQYWNQVWSVSRADIEHHILNASQPNYIPDPAIGNWPAHGDTTLGMAYNLAPFDDVDGNGYYSPTGGDYPRIKGDQALYMIYNDDWIHSETGGQAFGVEVHLMAYAYDHPDLANTIFCEYTLHNRTNTNYSDVYFSMFTDFDIGGATDDYLGCDVERDMFFGYNGDAYDESTGSAIGYGDFPPIQAVVFLEGPPADDDGLDNTYGVAASQSVNGQGYGDGIIDNERLGMRTLMCYNNHSGATGDPAIATDYYNFMRAYWKDGQPITYGMLGTDPGNPAARYMFPGDSDPLGYGTDGTTTGPWTEELSGNDPNDRRGIGSCGPFSFGAGESFTSTVAHVYINNPVEGNLPALESFVDQLHIGYQNNTLGTDGPLVAETLPTQQQASLWPNPAKAHVSIQLPANTLASMELYNTLGAVVRTQQLQGSTTLIDIQNLPSGLYFVRLQGAGINETHRLTID